MRKHVSLKHLLQNAAHPKQTNVILKFDLIDITLAQICKQYV